MSEAALKQSLLSIVDGFATYSMGPFEQWSRSPGVTPDRARVMLKADLKQAFIAAYGGGKVVQALASAGLTKLLINDLSRVVGPARAARLIGEITHGEGAPPASSTSSAAQSSSSPDRPKSNRLEGALTFAALIVVGALLVAFASQILAAIGVCALAAGFGALFIKRYQAIGCGLLVGSVIALAAASALRPTPSLEAHDSEPPSAASDSAESSVSASETQVVSTGRPYRPTREEQCGRAGRLATRMVYGKAYRDNQYKNLEAAGYCPD